VPASLQLQVDRTLTFAQLKESPDSYRGRLILVGGEVLSAKRLKDGTRIEVLQIPLEESQAPGTDRMTSEGRLLAIQKEFLDPATIPPGTRLTIVGEVTGAMTLPLTKRTIPTRRWRSNTSRSGRKQTAPSAGPATIPHKTCVRPTAPGTGSPTGDNSSASPAGSADEALQ
jgi:Starvation-inducible outer membrane lipoprotein